MSEFLLLQFCIYLFSIYILIRWRLHGVPKGIDLTLSICALSAVIATVYLESRKGSKVEPFVEGSSPEINYENRVVNYAYKERLFEDEKYVALRDGLAYCLTSSDMSTIDIKRDVIYNVVDKQNAALIQHTLLNNNFHQQLGFKVDSQIVGYPCNKLFANYNNFSIFMQFNLGVKMHNANMRSTKCNLLTLYTNNVMRSTRFLEVSLEYKSGKLNPSIIMKFCGETSSSTLDNLSYHYKYSDYLKSKVFADGKYHTMCIIKNHNDVSLYVDHHLLINCKDNEDTNNNIRCFSMENVELSDGETEIMPSASPFRINYNNNSYFWFWMRMFGIYPNRVLTEDDVRDLSNYCREAYEELDPKIQNIMEQMRQAQETAGQFTKVCPYPEYICNKSYCRDVKNWRDVRDLTMDERCFKAINAYCNEKGEENPVGCAFASKDAVFKMASAIDPNLFYYNKDNVEGNYKTLSADTKKKLARLGLKDLYLDKSIKPPDGKQASNLAKTIDELLESNQMVTIDTVNAVGESPPEVGKMIDYDALLESTANVSGEEVPSFEELYRHLITSEMKTVENFTEEEQESESPTFFEEDSEGGSPLSAESAKYKAIMQAYKSRKLASR